MRFLFPILMLTVALSGCEKSITINLPEQSKKLVLNAIVLRGDQIHANLTRSLSNAESDQHVDASVAGALIVLHRDGQAVDTLSYMGDGDYLSTIEAEAGHHYRIMVTHPDYPALDAEADAPEVVPVTEYSVVPNARGNMNNGDQDQLKIRFKDPATTGDFYIIQILRVVEYQNEDVNFYTWESCVQVSDPSVESPYTSDLPGEDACYPSRSLFMKDVLFNGQEKVLSMYVSSYLLDPYWEWQGTDTTYSVLRMFHVTPDFYRFVKSYRSSQDASDNPFAEPFNIASTVKGGYGVFSILSEDVIEIRK